mgnify:CR=1 FL=1
MATTRLTKTFSGNGDRQKFTFSAWIKRATTAQSFLWTTGSYSSSSMTQWLFDSDGTLGLYDYNSSGSVLSNVVTNRKFRDTNAWYHLVIRVDTTQSTAADRIRVYVNGVQETSFSATNYPGQNDNYIYSESITAQYIGQRADQGNTSSFEGLMSHIHMTDGYSYDASSFGSTDSTTGEWKINTAPSVTYGTNGYFILKDGNSVTDQSGNSNNFTVANGTLTQTEDNPSNNFATFNFLLRHGQTTSDSKDFFENANTTFYTPSTNDARKGFFVSSLGMSSGKYYCETKVRTGGRLFVGICNMNVLKSTSVPYDLTNQSFIGYYALDGNIKYDSDSTYATSVTASNNDILGFALDMDNSHWYIHKNGTYINSGDPTSGSTGTGSIIGNITSGSSYFNHGEMFFMAADFSTTGYARAEFNFGNGFFASTAISSEGTNASNIGKFEYNVPTGYTALSTKGLNE